MDPKSEDVAPLSPPKIRALLHTYINFLAVSGKHNVTKVSSESIVKSPVCDMAAVFDRSDLASPLAYDASQTALLLLDFQGFIVDRMGVKGKSAVAKGKVMRDWALSQKMMVVHSVVDVKAKPPAACKGKDRINKMLEAIANDQDAAEEPTEISFGKRDNEYIVLKHPGIVSGLKSTGAMEVLAEHSIKSLIICGLSTSGAVLRTAIPATDEGFIVSVIQDACADPVEGLHETLCSSVLPSRAHVATADEFLKAWAELKK